MGGQIASAQGTYSSPSPLPSTDPSKTESQRKVGQTREQTTRGERSKITISFQNHTIEDALHGIARQAQFKLVYSDNNPTLQKRVTLKLSNVNVFDAFASVLQGTGLSAELHSDGETVVIRPYREERETKPAQSTVGIIAGRITDSATGKGISGVTVSVLGIKRSTLTSDQGAYVLKDIPVGEQSVSIRMFGYKSAVQSVLVTEGKTANVNAVLVANATMLSGIVTSVTGQQRKLEVGNDIATINVDSIMRVSPVTSVSDLLAARVPGVIVMPSSGIPGAPSRIRMRGITSVERDSDPIVIVDGVRVNAKQPDAGSRTQPGTGFLGFVSQPSPIDQIDPNSIATIDLYRGPSAAALYGADAANGVIVITTKQGRPGPAQWTISINEGRTKIPGRWPENFFGFGRSMDGTVHECFRNLTACQRIDSVVRFQPLNDPKLTVLDQGTSRGGSVTVLGGERSLKYSLTVSAANEIGVFRLPKLEEERFRADHGFSAPGWMKRPTQYGTGGAQSQVTLPLGFGGGTIALTSALFRSRQQQSSMQAAIQKFQSGYIDNVFLGVAPLLDEFYYQRQNKAMTFRSGASLTGMYVRSWLPLTATVGIDLGNAETRTLLPRNYILGSADSIGSYEFSRGTNQQLSFDIGTTLRRQGGGRIPGITLPVGFQLVHGSNTRFGAMVEGLPVGVNEPTDVSSYEWKNVSNSSISSSTYGWYLAPKLDLNSRIFFSPGIRIDGGSASGRTAGLSPFPKMDFSWIAVDEPENPAFGFLSLLRPRIAFGIAGVQPAPGDHLRLWRPATITPLGSTGVEVAQLYSLGNTKLRPERSREVEGGVDMDLWNQRVTLKLNGYYKLKYDAIIESPVAPSVGASTWGGSGVFRQNVGDIRNRGVEAAVSAKILDEGPINWYVSTNVSKNSNILLSLAPGVLTRTVGDNTRLVPGYPVYGIWERPIVGFHDADGNGVLDAGELTLKDSATYIGAPEPNYELTLNTSLSLLNGRIQFYTTFNYQNGMTQTSMDTDHIGARWGMNPNLTLREQALLMRPSQRVDVLRWQSLSVSWYVPPTIVRRMRLSSLILSLQGSNLGVHTNYRRGMDPSVNGFGAGGYMVIDRGELPQPRLWQLNVRIGG